MEWNAIEFNTTTQEIKPFNVLWYFQRKAKSLSVCPTKVEFAAELHSIAFAQFCGRCEWELVLRNEDNEFYLLPWAGCFRPEDHITKAPEGPVNWQKMWNDLSKKRIIFGNEIRIDVYDQLNMNWDKFVDFCWDNRKELEL